MSTNQQLCLPPHVKTFEWVSKSQRVREAVMHRPLLIPSFFKDPSFDGKITAALLHKMIDRRIGIEFEIGGALQLIPHVILKCDEEMAELARMKRGARRGMYSQIEVACKTAGVNSNLQKFVNNSCGEHVTLNDGLVKKYYGLYSYADEYDYGCYYPSDTRTRGHEYWNEIKVSIKSFRHLIGLYNLMSDMKKYCIENASGGIHIHVDVSQFCNKYKKVLLRHYTQEVGILTAIYTTLNERPDYYLDKAQKSFQYSGSYNPRVISEMKGGQISVRQGTGSVEFRMGHCTFDYSLLMSWILTSLQIIREVESIIRNRHAKEFDEIDQQSKKYVKKNLKYRKQRKRNILIYRSLKGRRKEIANRHRKGSM